MRPTYTGLPEEIEEKAGGKWISGHQWENLAEALGVNLLKEAELMRELVELAKRHGIDTEDADR